MKNGYSGSNMPAISECAPYVFCMFPIYLNVLCAYPSDKNIVVADNSFGFIFNVRSYI